MLWWSVILWEPRWTESRTSKHGSCHWLSLLLTNRLVFSVVFLALLPPTLGTGSLHG